MLIYHLAPAERWLDWPPTKPYLPAEYEADGFIHCTADEQLLLAVANQFYRQAVGRFVIISIDVDLLRAPLRWEQGQSPAGQVANEHLAPRFPHIYGPIDPEAVVEVRMAQRALDGTFISWEPGSLIR